MNLIYEYLYNNKSLSFISSYLVALGTFIFLQPKENNTPNTGFNLIAYSKHNCYHIHHWVYMLILALAIIFFIYQSNGQFNNLNLIIIAFLLGGASSDLVYKDLFVFRKDCPYNPLMPKLGNTTIN